MDKKYHFIGIGGIGMSALARILLDKKIPVSGSDLSFSTNTKELAQKGAVINKGHSAKHISPQHTVVLSSIIRESNPELIAARALNCRIMHRSELLADLMQGERTLVCTGTHGKTTTSSLLTTVLVGSGLDPTFAVGGMLQGLNGRLGKGGFFIAEGDESDASFLNYHPEGAIITNIGLEHMAHYKSVEDLHHAFKTFIGQITNDSLFFYCGDDSELSRLADHRGVSYGFSETCALRITHYRQEGWTSYFDMSFEGNTYKDISLNLIGRHNALNAGAVFGLALGLGIAEEKIRESLKTFSGVDRRCQKKGNLESVLQLDDYAVHPTEIKKTLDSIREVIEERRLVVLFQPHRYSRVRDLLTDFGTSFAVADQVYVDNIYPAGEEPIAGITIEQVIEEIALHSRVPCEKWSRQALMPHDVFVTMGAGDVTYVHDTLPSPKKLNVGIVFGGLSCEHEISLRSARFVAGSLDRTLYNVHYYGIDKKGGWITGEEAKEILETQTVVDSPRCLPLFDRAKELEICDLFLPILHGTNGEDGTIQGLFEMLGKPYIGPDIRSAAVAMDKILTKRIVSACGVPTPPDITFGYIEWQREGPALLSTIKKFPVYVKPVQLGSSVGVSCVERVEQLEQAIENAFYYDTKVMIEEGKVGCRELEFAVVGNSGAFRVETPPPGEKLAQGSFVDYEKKYSAQPVKTTLDAALDPDLLAKGRELAIKAYRAIGCTGMCRVDFLLDSRGEFWFFEMNTIPGMQQFSLFPKIWNQEGTPFDKLLNRLIVLALQRKRERERHLRCLASV